MSSSAAKVVRVKIEGLGFGSSAPHSSGNLLKSGALVTATQEDEAYLYWCEGEIKFLIKSGRQGVQMECSAPPVEPN